MELNALIAECTILANTFKDRTKQEWNKKYLLSFGLVTGAGSLEDLIDGKT